MATLPDFVRLENASTTVIFCCGDRLPELIYFGSRLADDTTGAMLALLSTRQEAKCSPAIEPPLSVLPNHGDGFTGSPGVLLSGDDDIWAAAFTLTGVEKSQGKAVFHCEDALRKLSVTFTVELDEYARLMVCQSEIENQGQNTFEVQRFDAASLPLPSHIGMLKAFEGRWSNEFQTRDIPLSLGSYVRENRRGKSSHDSFPGIIAFADRTSEQQGECYGFHLATSGNHRVCAERMADGRQFIQMGELLFPSEITLRQGQRYSSPKLYAAHSDEGFNGLSRQFHHVIRANILRHTPDTAPRPVHYNTWEGIYFDHDINTIKQLAEKAGALGAQRFVLDDGWFKGRRNDKAGLGDWTVDKAVYPDGLNPLIEHVNAQGMEFGIWFEPEMVNPDSDLYRAHPDWVLQTRGNPQVPFRNQYVLDLTRAEVTEYLYNAIDNILTEYPAIRYIKWDMNRDINHPGGHDGKPAVSGQIHALYALIERVRRAHPSVEIESCCSGGGRVDLGILPYTDRFWTSDSNDALDRLNIQRGFSYFFPPEVMGAHIGPRHCHITGRVLPIETRAAVALFGHMGMEMDPRELTEHESNVVRDAFALYKANRHLIHSGDLYRLDSDGLSLDFGVVSQNKQRALFTYNSVVETPRTTPGRYRFAGLNPEGSYRLNRIWPETLKEYSASVLAQAEGQVFTGEALMKAGLQLPVLFPQTSLIFALEMV